MASAQMTAFAEQVIVAIKSYVARALDSRVDALEARIKSLELRPTLVYRGVWAAEEAYQEGDFVTDHGALWHCNAIGTKARPGASDDWQLAVKRGRDARR